ncbi:energy-coupling factor transporter transmembrane component T family protein [Terrilactibacillus laevilacticus]|uniref:Energy-coupling factor transporter transmembrane protein EcfT n=1 Tax=Terrilactibacillus laevilacticus TaxID=1380157 RepID=A0ABW5PRA4_9BACI|nr:energy-coupling factor transporter transmembrane component T [Terrilactibacillus laevilacticus]
MNNLIIGQYFPGDSYLHRLDPRSKLISVFILVCIIFIANSWTTYGMLFLFTCISVMASKLPLRFIYRGLKPIFFILLFTFIVNVLSMDGGKPLIDYGVIHITSGGLVFAIFITLRIMIIVMITTLLTLTTPPISFADGIEVLFSPLKKIKVPVHEFALMMSISLRFIPTLMEETDKIMKAQAARGSDLSTGPLRQRIKAIVPLLVPLFVSSFKRADDLAMAMESRGYRGDVGRTRLRELKWSSCDSIVLVLVTFLVMALILMRIWGI